MAWFSFFFFFFFFFFSFYCHTCTHLHTTFWRGAITRRAYQQQYSASVIDGINRKMAYRNQNEIAKNKRLIAARSRCEKWREKSAAAGGAAAAGVKKQRQWRRGGGIRRK
jgi:hypothetical protein